MNYAVINNENKVVNVINADESVIEGLQHGMGLRIENCDGIPLNMLDDFSPEDGKFYREGIEVERYFETLQGSIQRAIDAYTLELILGGIIA